MFQSFDTISEGAYGPERVARLREIMANHSLDVWLLPHGDEHQNEYQPERSARLQWMSGFTGSAGFLIVTENKAVLFVDGRYTLQAAEQVEKDHFQIESLIDTPPSKWLEDNLSPGSTIGFDPWCLTIGQRKQFQNAADQIEGKLKPAGNLVDEIWHDQPPLPIGKVTIQDLQYAGKGAIEKIEATKKIIESKAELAVVTDPSSICWLFNIRGCDVAHNPVTMAWTIIRADDRPLLFIDKRKLTPHVEAYLTQLADIALYETFEEHLSEVSRGAKVMLDPALCASAIADIITGAGGEIVEERDPVALPRACKNETELAGARKAHIRDGVAMVRFLHWVDTTPVEGLDEITATKKLEEFRKTTGESLGAPLREISFDTISGFGPNGAIVHYRVNEASNKSFSPNSLYLVDSGGQYDDGTTDITRTLAIGTPPADAIMEFTLVLKGHIALARARFPKGTRGVDLDGLARNSLWQHGRDYNHGTGHGVGSYLAVHEGPQSISRRGMQELLPGMILSNEPGYYRSGQYGIRIENLVIVSESSKPQGGNIEVMEFETITLCPIDHRLIDPKLLSEEELAWLNAYHARVREELSPYLEDEPREWLNEVTAELTG